MYVTAKRLFASPSEYHGYTLMYTYVDSRRGIRGYPEPSCTKIGILIKLKSLILFILDDAFRHLAIKAPKYVREALPAHGIFRLTAAYPVYILVKKLYA